MRNYIKQVHELDEAIYHTSLSIGNARQVLNRTTDYNIIKEASEALLRWLVAYKHELTQLERLSNEMPDEEIDKLENLWVVRIGTSKKRTLYTTGEYEDYKYLYVEEKV